MKIKVYNENGTYRIVKILASDDLKTLSNLFERWEYIL